jgi:hypothetical protein
MTTRSQIPEVPTPNSADKTHAALRAVLAVIPGAGGAIVELLSMVVAPPIEKRRTEWMETVSQALAALQDQRRMNLNSLRDNPLFIDAVLEASRIALQTSQEEKLQALRNAVLNSALGVEADETFHQILLNLLDAQQFPASHR